MAPQHGVASAISIRLNNDGIAHLHKAVALLGQLSPVGLSLVPLDRKALMKVFL